MCTHLSHSSPNILHIVAFDDATDAVSLLLHNIVIHLANDGLAGWLRIPSGTMPIICARNEVAMLHQCHGELVLRSPDQKFRYGLSDDAMLHAHG